MNVNSEKANSFPSRKQHKRNYSKHLIDLNVRRGGRHETPWENQKRLIVGSDHFFLQTLEELLIRTKGLHVQHPSNDMLAWASAELEQLIQAVYLLQNGYKAPDRGREVMFDRYDKVVDVLGLFK